MAGFSNIEAGNVPIYSAVQNIYDYYRSAAQLPSGDIRRVNNIGVIGPLLTDRQYDMLMDALGIAAGVDIANINDPTKIPRFEEILRDLSLHFEKYGFYIDERADLVQIQEAFGLIVDHNTYEVAGVVPDYSTYTSDYEWSEADFAGIRPEMRDWWRNLRVSNQQKDSLIYRLYKHYIYLITEDWPDCKKFRAQYYWYHD
ncbi:MAG: hypothetical protein ACTSYY_16925 [Promethearchaeota archaeon]